MIRKCKASLRKLETRLVKLLVVITSSVLLLISNPNNAVGDPGGQIPMPGLCDYPFVGITGMVEPGVGQAAWYGCRGMQEINGSYWIQGLAYYSSTGNMSSGNILGINLGVGGGGGITGYFCLDDPYHPTQFRPAADPNPVSAWKNKIEPSKCEPLNDQVIQVPGFVPPAPDQFPTGAVTNPAAPNPATTENPSH